MKIPTGISILVRCDSEEEADGRIPIGEIADTDDLYTYVRELPSEAAEMYAKPRRRPRFERVYGCVSEEEKTLLETVVLMRKAFINQDDSSLQKALDDWSRLYPASYLWGPTSQSHGANPLFELGKALNSVMQSIRFVMWWKYREEYLVHGLYCERAVAGLYLLAFPDSRGLIGSFDICERCGNSFIRSKQTKRYCSEKCRVAHAMARSRARRRS